MRRLACVILLTAACTSPPPPSARHASPAPAVLRVALGGAPASLDPALQRDPWERGLASFYLEPLLEPKADLSDVQPAAAASYEVSPDGRVYTFHLRSDGRFWDGEPVTAADFVFAWRRLIDPRIASPHADLFASVVAGGAYAEALDPGDPAAPIDAALGKLGLSAPDPATFQVTLERPSAWFKWVATVWAGAPLEAAGLKTNGPFRVASSAGGAYTLVPNPYFRTRPKLREVIAYPGSPPDVDIGPASAPAPPGFRLVRMPLQETEWIAFNTFRPPFDRVAVRQAFAAAIDRQAYVSGPLHGAATPAEQLLPAGLPGRLLGPAGLQAYDPVAARTLLKPNPVPSPGPHLLVEDTPSGHALGDFVRAQLAANLGVHIAVDAVPAKTFAQRIGNRDFDFAGPQRWLGDYPDPQDWLDQFTTGSGANVGRWQDPLYDELVQLADESLDAGARQRAYAAAEQELDSQAAAVFLDQPIASVLVSKRVRGLVPSPLDPAPVLGVSALGSLDVGP